MICGKNRELEKLIEFDKKGKRKRKLIRIF